MAHLYNTFIKLFPLDVVNIILQYFADSKLIIKLRRVVTLTVNKYFRNNLKKQAAKRKSKINIEPSS